MPFLHAGPYQVHLVNHRPKLPGETSMEGAAVQLGAQSMLEYLFERLPEEPSGMYEIEEIVIWPEGEEHSAKRNMETEPDMGDARLAGQFAAYPNPFEDGIIFKVPKISQGHIVVRDLRGVELKRVSVEDGSSEIAVDLHDLAAGVYIAQLMDKGLAVKALKIVKH